jgi:hypothetical protein
LLPYDNHIQEKNGSGKMIENPLSEGGEYSMTILKITLNPVFFGVFSGFPRVSHDIMISFEFIEVSPFPAFPRRTSS